MAKAGMRVGIDLEQASIAGAQIRTTRQGRVLTNVGVRALPEGLVFEGEVVDVDGLAAELKSFWKESGFAGKKFALGVANQKIVVRTMEFPLIDEKELRAAIEFQAQEAIPIPVEDAILDHQVLSTVPGEDGSGRQKVLIVAAQSDMISQFVEVARKAGLTVDGIDLQAFALMRAVAPTISLVDEGGPAPETALALVNMASGITNLVVAAAGMPQFTRVMNLGCEALVNALVADRGVSRDEADRLRLNVGLSGPEPAYGDLEEDAIAQIHTVLDAATETFADEIRRSIDYYHSQQLGGQIEHVLLTGEGALTRNMRQYLEQALHVSVARGDPLLHVDENKSQIVEPDITAVAPRLAIAVGLALDDED